MNWASIINALRNLTSARFYVTIALMFILLLGVIYKDAVTVAIKDITFNPVEFREVKDLKGLEVSLDQINKKFDFVDSYAVYIYQPKEASYYKKVVVTNSDVVKRSVSLQGSFLEDQPTMNNMILQQDYFTLDKGDKEEDIKFMKELGIESLFVYRLYKKKTLGEIIFILKRKPNALELEELVKEVSPLMHMYII